MMMNLDFLSYSGTFFRDREIDIIGNKIVDPWQWVSGIEEIWHADMVIKIWLRRKEMEQDFEFWVHFSSEN